VLALLVGVVVQALPLAARGSSSGALLVGTRAGDGAGLAAAAAAAKGEAATARVGVGALSTLEAAGVGARAGAAGRAGRAGRVGAGSAALVAAGAGAMLPRWWLTWRRLCSDGG
jgi:hypothetical protein